MTDAPERIWVSETPGQNWPYPEERRGAWTTNVGQHGNQVEYIRADLCRAEPQGWKIKPLEFVEIARGLFAASTPFGLYHVWEGHYQAPCDRMGQPSNNPKADAQEDYENRIRSVLITEGVQDEISSWRMAADEAEKEVAALRITRTKLEEDRDNLLSQIAAQRAFREAYFDLSERYKSALEEIAQSDIESFTLEAKVGHIKATDGRRYCDEPDVARLIKTAKKALS